MLMFRALWTYRDFIVTAVKNEFRGRYVNSALGGSWAIIEPLALIVVFTVIFSQVMRPQIPGSDSIWAYSVYLCAGIIPWQYFVDMLSRCQESFIQNANLIKKVNFPKSVLPAIALGSATLHAAIIYSIFLLFLLIIGEFPGAVILWTIPLLILLQTVAVGLGLVVGVFHVFFRDVGKAVGVITMFWFWVTPIVYSREALSPQIDGLIQRYNPIAPIIGAFQDVMVHQQAPNWTGLAVPAGGGVLLLALGYFFFIILQGHLVDEL